MEWDTSIDERGKEDHEEEGESPKARHVFLALEMVEWAVIFFKEEEKGLVGVIASLFNETESWKL